jgi:hypothetical protein
MPTRTRLQAEPATRVAWDDHLAFMAQAWQPGDHVSVFAQTKAGKSVLVRHLLVLVREERIITFDCKGDDAEVAQTGQSVRKLPMRLGRALSVQQQHHYRIVVPDNRALGRAVVEPALNGAYREGDWVVNLDEVRAITDPRDPGLGLAPLVERMWIRGRSRRITLIAQTQGPRWVPSSMYDQAQFVYLSRLLDTRARKRIREIGGDTDRIVAAMDSLQKHEFVFLTQDGERCEIVRAPYP